MNARKGANKVEPIRDIKKIKEIKEHLLQRSYRNYFLFSFGINSGLRISDLLPLRAGNVRNQQYFIVQEKKTDKFRKVVITKVLKEDIAKYTYHMADDQLLFPSQKGNGPITRIHAWKIIHDAAKACGVEGAIGTHTLRKTFGYHFYQQYKDIAMLQYIFGHSSPAITFRYIGINDDMVNRAMEKFYL